LRTTPVRCALRRPVREAREKTQRADSTADVIEETPHAALIDRIEFRRQRQKYDSQL
jgi:hypothetical protein